MGFALCFVIFRAKYHAALPGVELTEIMNRAAFTKFFNVNRDIFLRTLLHVAVMSWFTISGARMDATILAANALLIQLFVIFSYISDGIAFSAEALSGRYIGAGNLGAFRKMMNVVGAMCAVAAAMFALTYAAGGAGRLSFPPKDERYPVGELTNTGFALPYPMKTQCRQTKNMIWNLFPWVRRGCAYPRSHRQNKPFAINRSASRVAVFFSFPCRSESFCNHRAKKYCHSQ